MGYSNRQGVIWIDGQSMVACWQGASGSRLFQSRAAQGRWQVASCVAPQPWRGASCALARGCANLQGVLSVRASHVGHWQVVGLPPYYPVQAWPGVLHLSASAWACWYATWWQSQGGTGLAVFPLYRPHRQLPTRMAMVCSHRWRLQCALAFKSWRGLCHQPFAALCQAVFRTLYQDTKQLACLLCFCCPDFFWSGYFVSGDLVAVFTQASRVSDDCLRGYFLAQGYTDVDRVVIYHLIDRLNDQVKLCTEKPTTVSCLLQLWACIRGDKHVAII